MVVPAVGSWSAVLAATGMLDGWRPSRGIYSTATDGHPCRSLFERYVDDFLTRQGIAHSVEPSYPHDAELNPNGLRADWKLADGTFVEAAGLSSNEYLHKLDRKRLLADTAGINLIILQPSDLSHLHQVFANQQGSVDN
ncbi:hypothetical protein NF556_07955 [Ornithinimicrobium faecis]|uniref:Uncharacterized protein n=1 Tax=Ornithinimicrobium faecis TaxID=2934158 RepID=A0ABY4YZL6_9MICO|nr:hypothetical protein [Ornithinimicrobium sp. HY1793]USQ81567.1 hypothetical protein NF556_07955 [Ornithinimicrobium sp. HY1793]